MMELVLQKMLSKREIIAKEKNLHNSSSPNVTLTSNSNASSSSISNSIEMLNMDVQHLGMFDDCIIINENVPVSETFGRVLWSSC